MALRHQQSGLNRTKWDNKSSKQRQKTLEKHYNNLGKTLPKYLQQGNITDNKLKKALKGLNTEYGKQVKKENRLDIQYNVIKKQYNQFVKESKLGLQMNRTKTERAYIRGEEIFIPTLRNKSFKADIVTLELLGKETLKTLKAKEERIRQIEQNLNRLKNNRFDSFYNNESNKKVFDDLLDDSPFGDDEQKILTTLFNHLTDFEKEIYTKKALSKIRDIYLKEGATPNDYEDLDKTKMFNAMYGIMRGIIKDNRGYDVGVSANGKVTRLD